VQVYYRAMHTDRKFSLSKRSGGAFPDGKQGNEERDGQCMENINE
jgi:hypothetical protein